MDIKKLQRAIVDGLEDVKAQDILVFDTERLSPLFERVIIASGSSNRQTKALASSVRETVKKRGMQVMRTEGEDNGEWIIVDCGAAVVHVMQPAIRQYYHLEEIWGGKQVKMKVASGEVRLVKASEPMNDDEDEAPAKPKKSAAKKAAAAAAPAAKKAPSRATGTKSATAKATGSKAAGTQSATGKTVGAKSTAAKASTAAKPAAKRPAAKRAASAPVETVKVGLKKPATKKAAPKAAAKPATKSAARPAAKAAKPAAKKTTVKTGTKSKA